MSDVIGIFVKFLAFLWFPLTKYGHVTWPKKEISKMFYFVLILHLILGKFTKFLVEKLSTSEDISQKSHRGGGVEIPPSAFRVNALERGAVVHQTIPRTLCPLLSHTCIHSCHTSMKIACCFDVTGARSGFLFPQNMNFRWLFFWTELRGVQYTKPMSSKKSLSCR